MVDSNHTGSFTSVVTIPNAESSIQQQSFEATLHKGLSGQQSSCDEEKEATRTSEEEEPSGEQSLEKGIKGHMRIRALSILRK